MADRERRHDRACTQGTGFERSVHLVVRGDVRGGESAVKKADDKRVDERKGEVRELAASLTKKTARGSSIDEMSLRSHRRAVAYGRARGNV